MKEQEIKYLPFKLNNLLVIKKIITIHYQEIDFDYSYQGESHDFWEMMYVDRSTVEVKINNKDTYTLNQKQIIFIKPNDFHAFSCKKNTNVFVLSFECSSVSMDYFKDKIFTLGDSEINILSSLIKEAKETFYLPTFNPDLKHMELLDNPLKGGEQLIKDYLEIFLINLLRNETKKPNSTIQFYSKEANLLEEKLLAVLKENIYNDLSLEDISNQVHFSTSYICSTFKKKYNETIISYFIRLRIEEAKKLLNKGYSVKEVSNMLHFYDVSHFHNSFRKYVKTTPKKYKEQINKQKSQ